MVDSSIFTVPWLTPCVALQPAHTPVQVVITVQQQADTMLCIGCGPIVATNLLEGTRS